MSDDEFPPTPLTDKGLARLRALATGNGLDPEKLVTTACDEQVWVFEGVTTLAPLFEIREERYDGPPRGKGRQILPSVEALHADVTKRKQEFYTQPDWIAAASHELRSHPGEGWGLDGARIELPKSSVVLAASENCKTCRGHKNIICTKCGGRRHELCTQCHGQRQEFCYNCNYNGSGTGILPHGQHCPICNDTRFIVCRLCHAAGQIACPTCHARGNVQCPTCKGLGQATVEIHITCGATTRFRVKAEGLPSIMRRGLDRLGLVNLSKGHAEIKCIEPKEPEEDFTDEYIPGGLIGTPPVLPATYRHNDPVRNNPARNDDDSNDFGFGKPPPDKSRPPDPVLHYQVRMPFADLRIDFGGRKAIVGVFGLRSVLIDVPPFLDAFLAPAIEKLQTATQGEGTVDDALKIRALHEAVELHLQGKGNLKEFRRLYPLGVSNDIMENILRATRQSIKRLSLRVRACAAVGAGILGAGIFAGIYFSPLSTRLAQTPKGIKLLDFGPLALVCGLGWAILNFAAYFDLHRHFPNAKIGPIQPIGKTGTAMFAALVIIWLAILAFSPVQPPWLSFLRHR